MVDPTPTVFCLDADVSVRRSIADLARGAGLRCDTFSSAQEFLGHARLPVPCCVVLDVELPDLSGLELQALLASERAEMPFIFTACGGDIATAVRAMKAGAFEFLGRPFDADAMLAAVRDAIEHSRVARARQANVQALRNRLGSLTPREREVMSLVVSGRLNKQVGTELGISEITVKAHRGRVMRKMCAASLPHLVTMAAALRL